jgi:ATP synthase protein I
MPRQYVARGLPGQVDFAAISSDGFFKAVALLLAWLAVRPAIGPRNPHSGGKGPMAERDGGEEDDRLLRARLEKLSSDLQKKRKESLPRPGAEDGGDSGKFGSAMGLGLRAASEFAAAIIVGGLIGWRLDAWLGTKPAFLIAFFMLGVAAGVWNVIRVTSAVSRGAPVAPGQTAPSKAEQNAPPGADEDED